MTEFGHRQPTWSGWITRPLARGIPAHWRREALVAIKSIHTAIFVSVFGAVLATLWDGVRGTPGRRTAIAGEWSSPNRCSTSATTRSAR